MSTIKDQNLQGGYQRDQFHLHQPHSWNTSQKFSNDPIQKKNYIPQQRALSRSIYIKVVVYHMELRDLEKETRNATSKGTQLFQA